ncbi:MAG: hypothetical protein EOM08_10355, partial [Clostridia bacterium]|nr:hypothetical protein [Clostridia bacterium]
MMNTRFGLVLCAICLAAAIVLAGCKPATPSATGSAEPGQTTVPSQPASSETAVSTEPAPSETPELLGPVEQAYQDKLAAYLEELPYVAAEDMQPASDTEQADLVRQMARLYAGGAESREIFVLYLSGITMLSPDSADLFTTYAISGMRRNSFEDYTEIEYSYTSDPAFLDRFFTEAEKFEFNWIELNRQSDAISDAKVKALVKGAQEQGYYVASSEGMIYYLVDFTRFAEYRMANTQTMADLIVTQAIDSLDPMSSDAAFIIDLPTLAARTYGIGQALEDYKGTRYEKYLASRFRDHLTLLFFGIDNTPNFDYGTGLMSDDANAALADAATLTETLMGQLTSEFLALVEANEAKMDDATR